MPVVLGGKLAGIVSIGDVVKFRLQELEWRPTSYAMRIAPRVDGGMQS